MGRTTETVTKKERAKAGSIMRAKATGTGTIVAACGWCESNFIDAINAKGEKIKVYDIIDVVQQQM